MNPLVALRDYGQSPWYDYIRRGLIASGDLRRMIEQDGLMGITSNPSIFEKAIGGSSDYDEALRKAAAEVMGVKEIYERLAVQDIQDAADLMRPVYESTRRLDGYVSLEVSPELAYDTNATIQEAIRLHRAVSRPNVMIKVPATPEGIPAIRQLLSRGINVNVTLLFSVTVYEQVAEAYLAGLESFAASGGDLSTVASVASFFISRIDTAVDNRLAAAAGHTTAPAGKAVFQRLAGKVAIASAKIAYDSFTRIFGSPRFAALQKQGAQVQRLLWASTGTKNPAYPDTYYVDQLIGPMTVNTMPAATYTAFRDHGAPRSSLQDGLADAREILARVADCGLDMRAISDQLLTDGTQLFVDAFDQLMSVISRKRMELLGPKLDRPTFSLGAAQADIEARLNVLRKERFVPRLWSKDASLWHRDPAHQAIIRNALGWLHSTTEHIRELPRLQAVSEDIRHAGFRHVLLLGMGGSSLCPEVLRTTFGLLPGRPDFQVLDSTVPAHIRRVESSLDLSTTLCIISSKSGSTTEPLAFYRYFYDRIQRIAGESAGKQFMAITDPGSLLERIAWEKGFRHILPGMPDIGGRYSALSNFGMAPAAIMGIGVQHLLYRAERMRHSCDACVPPEDNPGIRLGVAIGELARRGKNKLTFIISPAMSSLGAWLEQLIAESTGKENTGLIPIDEEPPGDPSVYGTDRVFVYIRDGGRPDSGQDAHLEALERAGHPVIRLDVAELINIGEEFFLWEMATAVAGALLGINAFDQPNVQESKDYTTSLLGTYSRTGSLEEQTPFLRIEDLGFYADDRNCKRLLNCRTLQSVLAAHFSAIAPGDYGAITAYLDRTPVVHRSLQGIRQRLRDKTRIATTLGYGPRFLHSTGQLHKGGPNSGIFLQITSDDPVDLQIPGEPYSFGVLKRAQALGDFLSLTTRERRVLRIHLGHDVASGLARILDAMEHIR